MLQRASSLDGRAFMLQAAVEGLDLQVGGYAVVETSDGPRIGQVVSLELATMNGPDLAAPDGTFRTTVRIRAVQGRGVVLGGPSRPFHDAPLRPAGPAEVGEWLAGNRPVSQCENLALMRMNSLADLAYVGEVFSFVPDPLLERATAFRQGESLVAGKLVSHPTYGRFGPRFAQEGGADVPATWAEAPPG